jgi:hypothetical protein
VTIEAAIATAAFLAPRRRRSASGTHRAIRQASAQTPHPGGREVPLPQPVRWRDRGASRENAICSLPLLSSRIEVESLLRGSGAPAPGYPTFVFPTIRLSYKGRLFHGTSTVSDRVKQEPATSGWRWETHLARLKRREPERKRATRGGFGSSPHLTGCGVRSSSGSLSSWPVPDPGPHKLASVREICEGPDSYPPRPREPKP